MGEKASSEARFEARGEFPSPEEGAETGLSEISGAIKWFDASKGYGFIIPDDGSPDVLLHVTCLRRDGFQTAYEGARIVVEAVQRAHLSDMVWSVPAIIAHLSTLYHLGPGDLIMTGTPAGVGAVRPGDALFGEVDGLAPVELTVGPAE